MQHAHAQTSLQTHKEQRGRGEESAPARLNKGGAPGGKMTREEGEEVEEEEEEEKVE